MTNRFILLCFFCLLMVPNTNYSQFLSPLPPSPSGDTLKLLEEEHIGDFSRWYIEPKILHSSEEMKSVYKDSKVKLFSMFSGTISKNQAYVMSEIIGGLLGSTRFFFTGSKVITNENTSDTTSIDLFEKQKSSITNLIHNGGNLSVKILYPFFVGGGRWLTHSLSVYPQAGLFFETDKNKEDLYLSSFGLVGDWIGSFAIRDSEDNINAELLVACRLGINNLNDKYLDFLDVEKNGTQLIPYFQLGLGIQTGETLKYSILYTATDKKFNKFVSEFSLQIQTAAF